MPGGGGPVAVGYDTRFQAEAFARAAAETLAAAGRDVVLSDGPCPTPAVSCQVAAAGSPFGLVLTASHNPPEFCGLKIKTSLGGSAGGDVTRRIEDRLGAAPPAAGGSPPAPPGAGPGAGSVRRASFLDEHRRRVAALVDLDAIRRAGIRVVFDAMHGAAGRALEAILDGGTTRVETLRAQPDPLFGGVNPEPLPPNLGPLEARMRAGGADVGLATDGDGDRIGAYDERGRFVTPLKIAPLLALRLLARGGRGAICKTYANTIYLDRIAARHGQPFSVFPVGFKHIAERMAAGGFLIGGEESGGIGVAGYLPERDGLLISLMLAEAIAAERKPLSALVADLEREYGALAYARRDIPCPTERGRSLAASLRVRTPGSLGGMTVTGIDTLDGVKLLFGADGWILARPSGTEPVLRVYCEAPTAEAVGAALDDLLARVAAG
jgi:phosphomannomutase